MENREESYLGITGIVKNFSQTFFKYVGDLVRLAKLEALLAKKSFVQICVLSSIVFILLLTTVIGIFAFIVVSFIALGVSLILSLGGTILIFILLIAILGLSIFQLKKNLNFSATRKQLSFKGKEK